MCLRLAWLHFRDAPGGTWFAPVGYSEALRIAECLFGMPCLFLIARLSGLAETNRGRRSANCGLQGDAPEPPFAIVAHPRLERR